MAKKGIDLRIEYPKNIMCQIANLPKQKMFRLITFFFLMILTLEVQSQVGLNNSFQKRSRQKEKCDTINIDKCYITFDGRKIETDTNIKEVVKGWGTIKRVRPCSPDYSILYVEMKDTFCVVYDSITFKDSLVYLVDTSISTMIYNLLVENKIIQSRSELKVGNTIYLSLMSFYNKVKLFSEQKTQDDNDNLSRTWSCEQCYKIILSGKVLKTYDCPLFNNLYRLK